MKFKKIYIELSDICGLDCSFCPSIKGRRGVMSLELFSKIALECSKYTKLIALHILGDPLKIKNLKDYLMIAHKLNISVEITTSGVYLDDFDFLRKSPIKQVNISLDAIMELQSQSFKKRALNRVFEFCRYKDSSNSDIFVNLRIQNRKSPQTAELKSVLKQEFNLLELDSNTRVGKKIIIVFRESFLWHTNKSDIVANTGFCYGLISHFGILSNGDVVPCCIDANGDIVLGNLNKDSLKNILYSSRVQRIINGFKNGIVVEKKCINCNYRMQFN